MKNYPETRDCDFVFPLRYSEKRDMYRVPYFCTPSRLSWLRTHSDLKLYLHEVDNGIFVIGSIRGDKVPNAKKIRIECPHEQDVLLEAVDSKTLFCGQCAPHKYVRNGEIKKKIIHLSDYGGPSYEIPGEE